METAQLRTQDLGLRSSSAVQWRLCYVMLLLLCDVMLWWMV